MRYINRTNKERHEAGISKEVKTMKGLSKESITKLEERKLGILKRSIDGQYRIIKESGLGAGIEEIFKDLAELNEFVKNNF